jgi:hypothetical protein
MCERVDRRKLTPTTPPKSSNAKAPTITDQSVTFRRSGQPFIRYSGLMA